MNQTTDVHSPSNNMQVNPNSTIWESFACGIRNTENFCLWDLKSCALESAIQLKEP